MVKKLEGFNNLFIHSDGYVFRQIGLKEYVLKTKISGGYPRVDLGVAGKKRVNLVYLMIEYFSSRPLLIDDKVKFKIIDGKIPIKQITVSRINRITGDDEILIFKYRCVQKANNQNKRAKSINRITSGDVLDCLKRSNFKCIYCGGAIKTKDWHLDHVHPLCMGGLNVLTNIAPSCPVCNLMKNKFNIDHFLMQVMLIYENYDLKNYYENFGKTKKQAS